MSVLMYTPWANRGLWRSTLEQKGLKVIDAFDSTIPYNRAEAALALVWQPPRGLLTSLPNLKGIQSMGAGVDALLADASALPIGVPIARLVDPRMSSRMATFVLGVVINHQRRFDDYLAAQQRRAWDKEIENLRNIDNDEVRVLILGAGEMGLTTARLLNAAGYVHTTVWSRTGARVTAADLERGIQSISGRPQLLDALPSTTVLVNLLPLTPETNGILNASLFGLLPEGSAVVNAARGAHLNESDLLDALDSGRIRAAYLDVFPVEPLPVASPLWEHPGVRVFPHVSAISNIATSCDQIMENFQRAMDGAPLRNQVYIDRGY